MKQRIIRRYYLLNYKSIYITSVVLICIGVCLTIMGAFAVSLVVPESARTNEKWQPVLRSSQLQKYRTELSQNQWKLLKLVFNFRYFGPVCAGVGIFILGMTYLHNLWITEKEVKKINAFLYGGSPAQTTNNLPAYFEPIFNKWKREIILHAELRPSSSHTRRATTVSTQL